MLMKEISILIGFIKEIMARIWYNNNQAQQTAWEVRSPSRISQHQNHPGDELLTSAIYTTNPHKGGSFFFRQSERRL